MKNVTIKDVARQAGYSVGTVSRVINNKPVSAKTRDAVLKTMVELGYTPNAIAQSMRTNTTKAVALVVNDISNPLFSGIAKAAEDMLRTQGYFLLISNTNNDPKIECEIVETLRQRRIDGMIIAVSDESNKKTQEVLGSVSFPVVLLDRELPQEYDSVCDDHYQGMEQAVKYLMDLGHQNIKLISGSDKIRPGRVRIEGFKNAFRKKNIVVKEEQISQGRFDSVYGYEEAYKALTSRTPPTAIIAGGNQIFTGVLRAVKSCKLEIPRDISIIACDDIDLTTLMRPPITVITRNLREIGRVTGDLLMSRILNPAETTRRRILMPTELVVRESCQYVSGR
ncbi:MAG: LacI family DNA-binding transcriptional regulator [Gammaproteobacteria bacterium]